VQVVGVHYPTHPCCVLGACAQGAVRTFEGLIGVCHIEREGLIGRCHIEGEGLIGRCKIGRVRVKVGIIFCCCVLFVTCNGNNNHRIADLYTLHLHLPPPHPQYAYTDNVRTIVYILRMYFIFLYIVYTIHYVY
jgi:hypothetical protein